MGELLNGPIDYYGTTIKTDVNNDIISFYIDDYYGLIPRAQYAIDEEAGLVRIAFDESKSAVKQVVNHFELLEKYGEKTKIRPSNGWKYGSKLLKIDDRGTFLWRSSGDAWLIKKKQNGYNLQQVDYELRDKVFGSGEFQS